MVSDALRDPMRQLRRKGMTQKALVGSASQPRSWVCSKDQVIRLHHGRDGSGYVLTFAGKWGGVAFYSVWT